MRATHETAHAKRDAFLAAYAELGTITHAARAVGISARRHYDWLAADPEYGLLFAEAGVQARDAMVREARRRALEGNDKPVYQGGKLVGTIREYSDTLLIFLMKGAMPETYRERIDITTDVRTAIERMTADPAERAAAMLEVERILSEARG